MASTRVRSAVATSIANNVLTPVPFELTRWDDEVMHNNAINNTRLSVITAGDYRVGACIGLPVSAAGAHRRTYLRVNGTTYIAGVDAKPTPSSVLQFVLATDWRCAAGDYFETVVLQDTGAAAALAIVASATPEMWALRYG